MICGKFLSRIKFMSVLPFSHKTDEERKGKENSLFPRRII
jgi:hypothetical protein